MSEELYGGRSILSGIPMKLVLVEWQKPVTPSVSWTGEVKDEQKCSTIWL